MTKIMRRLSWSRSFSIIGSSNTATTMVDSKLPRRLLHASFRTATKTHKLPLSTCKSSSPTESTVAAISMNTLTRYSSCRRNSYNTASPTTSSSSQSRKDEEEVQKFSKMSHQWWDVERNPLIHMNPIRIHFIQDCIQKYYILTSSNSSTRITKKDTNDATTNNIQQQQEQQQQSLRILDVGCGGGLLSESLVRLRPNDTIVGIDASKSLIDIAQYHAQQTLSQHLLPNIQYVNMTVREYIESLSTSSSSEVVPTTTEASTTNTNSTPKTIDINQQFDVICCLEVLEHIPNYQIVLQDLCQYLLKDDGLLIVSTINPTIQSYFVTIIGAEYVTQYIPRGTHDWNQYLSPQTIEKELSNLTLSASSSVSQSTTLNNEKGNDPVTQQYTMQSRIVTGMVIPVSSIPSILLNNQWNWQFDPSNTNINWIGCYQKQLIQP